MRMRLAPLTPLKAPLLSNAPMSRPLSSATERNHIAQSAGLHAHGCLVHHPPCDSRYTCPLPPACSSRDPWGEIRAGRMAGDACCCSCCMESIAWLIDWPDCGGWCVNAAPPGKSTAPRSKLPLWSLWTASSVGFVEKWWLIVSWWDAPACCDSANWVCCCCCCCWCCKKKKPTRLE